MFPVATKIAQISLLSVSKFDFKSELRQPKKLI